MTEGKKQITRAEVEKKSGPDLGSDEGIQN